MTRQDAAGPGGQQEPGDLLRVVEDRLMARGFRVRRMPDPRSRLVKVAPLSVTSPADYPDSEVVVEDDGYVELRYWPPAQRLGDPQKFADLIADFLFRNLGGSAEAQS